MIHGFLPLLAHDGYWVAFLIVFLNNLCFPVPGDTMLLATGFLSQKGDLSLWVSISSGTAAAFLGCTGGYWIGSRLGRRLMDKIRWLQVTPKRVRHIELFFEKYGPKAVFFARFVALLHPVTGLLAGMWKTPLRPFLIYNLAGSAGYATLYVLVGYFFGQRWELFKSWIGPIALYTILIAAMLLILGLFLRNAIRAFFNGQSPTKKKTGRDIPKARS